MVNETRSTRVRPMNVFVASGSKAENAFRARAGVPGSGAEHPEVIAPGIKPEPSHDLTYHGGKTIPNLIFTNFYVGGGEAWAQSDIQSIDQALAAAMSDEHLNNVIVQYFPNQKITTTFQPSSTLPGPAPAVVSQGDVENIIGDLYKQELLKKFDLGSTVFNLMLPKGTVLNADPAPTGSPTPETPQTPNASLTIEKEEADSLNGLGGYHGSIHVTGADGNKDTVYYAVGVYSERLANGKFNGIPVFEDSWKNIVATFYHELNEARTDADVEDAIRAGDDPSAEKFLGWMSNQGEECGDFPVFEANPLTQVVQEVQLADGSGTVPIQFMYSNAAHGPEGPIDAPHEASKA